MMTPPQNPEHKHNETSVGYEDNLGVPIGAPLQHKHPQRVDWREPLRKLMDENYGYIHQTAHSKVEDFIATIERDARRAVIEEAIEMLPDETTFMFEEFNRGQVAMLKEIRALLTNLKQKDV